MLMGFPDRPQVTIIRVHEISICSYISRCSIIAKLLILRVQQTLIMISSNMPRKLTVSANEDLRRFIDRSPCFVLIWRELYLLPK